MPKVLLNINKSLTVFLQMFYICFRWENWDNVALLVWWLRFAGIQSQLHTVVCVYFASSVIASLLYLRALLQIHAVCCLSADDIDALY